MSGQSWKEICDAMRAALPPEDRRRKVYKPPGSVFFEAVQVGSLFWFVTDGEIMQKCSTEAASYFTDRGTCRVGHKTGVYPLTDEQAAAARVAFPRPRVPVDGRDLIEQFDTHPAGPTAKAKRARAPRKVPKADGPDRGSA